RDSGKANSSCVDRPLWTRWLSSSAAVTHRESFSKEVREHEGLSENRSAPVVSDGRRGGGGTATVPDRERDGGGLADRRPAGHAGGRRRLPVQPALRDGEGVQLPGLRCRRRPAQR